MRHILLLLLIGLVYWNIGCTRTSTPYPHSMQVAESCMATEPDQALELLQAMEDSISNLNEEAQMYYHLLTLQAETQQYIIHTSDSLIRHIVSYYEENGTPTKLMLAYYLMGKVYTDMNDAPQALKAYQQALDIKSKDLSMKVKIYNEMHPLFANQGLYDEAIRTQRNVISLYRQLKNQQGMVSIQRGMAKTFEQKGEKDSAVHHYREACATSLSIKDSTTYYSILAELTGLLYDTEEAEKVIHTLKQIERRTDISEKSHIYFILGQIYKDREQWDSAYHYNQLVVHSGNIEKAYYSYKDLYALEKQRKNHTKALEYLEKAQNTRNLMQTISQREAVVQINALYNYQHISDENADLRLNKERQKNIILILVLLLTLLTFAGLALIAYLRKRSRLALEQAQRLKQLAEEQYAKSQTAIRDNERKMEDLKRQLAEAQNGNNQSNREMLEMEMKKLQLQNEEIRLSKNEQQQRINSFMESNLFRLIQQASLDETILIQEQDWKKINEAIDFMYPTFNKHLNEIFPYINVNAKQLCWLTKIGISPMGIARILKRSKQAISNMRTKLSKKIGELSLPGDNFDDFMKNFS